MLRPQPTNIANVHWPVGNVHYETLAAVAWPWPTAMASIHCGNAIHTALWKAQFAEVKIPWFQPHLKKAVQE